MQQKTCQKLQEFLQKHTTQKLWKQNICQTIRRNSVMACLRKCKTFHKKNMAFIRQLELIKRRTNLESTPDMRKKIVKEMVEKYYSEFLCYKC